MPEGIKFLAKGLPYLKTSGLKGKLIAIEGTDGVGRSTQIDLLEEWLQVQGYAVIVSGWTRSNLMSRSIEMAKNGNAQSHDLQHALCHRFRRSPGKSNHPRSSLWLCCFDGSRYYCLRPRFDSRAQHAMDQGCFSSCFLFPI